MRRRTTFGQLLTLAEEADSAVRAPGKGAWLARLEEEHANLRTALRWSLDGAVHGELGLRLARALWWFWYRRGHVVEGGRWLEALLGARSQVPPSIWSGAVIAAGWLAYFQGDFANAAARADAGRIRSHELGDVLSLAHADMILGLIELNQGDYGRVQLLQDSLAVYRTLGEEWFMSFVLYILGELERGQGDYNRAESLYEESLLLSRKLDDKETVALLFSNLALVVQQQGDSARATSLCDECLLLVHELGRTWLVTIALTNLSTVARAQGDYGRAAAFLQESLVRYRDLGYRPSIAVCLQGLAEVASARGKHAHAAWLFGAAAALREDLHQALLPSEQTASDQATSVTQTALGETTYAASWSQGHGAPLRDTLVAALAGSESDEAGRSLDRGTGSAIGKGGVSHA